MIPFDILYIRPDSLNEAVDAYMEHDRKRGDVLYYAGGTEIITRSRVGKVRPRVLIDIKRIPECIEIGKEGDERSLVAALTLNSIVESDLFLLLSAAADRVADHTTRNQITLGGNCAGNLPYRESLLPLLVAEAEVEIAGPGGARSLRLDETFDKQLRLEPGELLVKFRVQRKMASAPCFYRRHEVSSRIDYPLVAACFLKGREELRMAVGGSFGHPVRSAGAERVLNDRSMEPGERAKQAIDAVHAQLRDDFRGSASYREILLERTIEEALTALEEEHGDV
jgi:CO/xanthine dehydrogenase FAD-binding subunit